MLKELQAKIKLNFINVILSLFTFGVICYFFQTLPSISSQELGSFGVKIIFISLCIIAIGGILNYVADKKPKVYTKK